MRTIVLACTTTPTIVLFYCGNLLFLMTASTATSTGEVVMHPRSPLTYPPDQLRTLDLFNPPDHQTLAAYLLPQLSEKYGARNQWGTSNTDNDQKYYATFTDYDDTGETPDDEMQQQQRQHQRQQKQHYLLLHHLATNGGNTVLRSKRFNSAADVQRKTRFNYEEPSLSINAPIQSLRKVYAKERLRQRLEANRRFLENLVDTQ